jgi:hypothetical protein
LASRMASTITAVVSVIIAVCAFISARADLRAHPRYKPRHAASRRQRTSVRILATRHSGIFAGEGGDDVNIAEQDLIAQKTTTCPRCGALPGKRCWEKARGNPRRKTLLARPHAERAELVQDDGLTAWWPGRVAAVAHKAVGARGDPQRRRSSHQPSTGVPAGGSPG